MSGRWDGRNGKTKSGWPSNYCQAPRIKKVSVNLCSVNKLLKVGWHLVNAPIYPLKMDYSKLVSILA